MVDDKYCVSKSQWKVIKTSHHLCNLLVPKNNLNHILSTFVDSEDNINNLSTSNYVAMADIQSIFQTGQSDFVIAALNIQSIKAKFDNLYETYKHNLKMHQGYLNQCIRTAKKEYYDSELYQI